MCEVNSSKLPGTFKPRKNALNRWCVLCWAVSKPGFSHSSPVKINLHFYKVHAQCIPLNVAACHVRWRGVCDYPSCKIQGWPKLPQVCRLSARVVKPNYGREWGTAGLLLMLPELLWRPCSVSGRPLGFYIHWVPAGVGCVHFYHLHLLPQLLALEELCKC